MSWAFKKKDVGQKSVLYIMLTATEVTPQPTYIAFLSRFICLSSKIPLVGSVISDRHLRFYLQINVYS